MALALAALEAGAGDGLRTRDLWLLTAIPAGAMVYAGGLRLLAPRFVREQVRDLRGLVAARRRAS
jgi:hypothetical protein